MDWEQEVLKCLDALADKLGTTSAYLWHVLVRQAIVSGIADAVFAVSLLGLTGIYAYYARAIYKWANDTDDEFDWFVFGAGATAALVCLVGGLISLNLSIVQIINPEYFALHEVLQALGR